MQQVLPHQELAQTQHESSLVHFHHIYETTIEVNLIKNSPLAFPAVGSSCCANDITQHNYSHLHK